MKVICKIDTIGELFGYKYQRNKVYNVSELCADGTYLIDYDWAPVSNFLLVDEKVVVHIGVNGKETCGFEMGKEYSVIGVLKKDDEEKAYYIMVNGEVRCVSSKLFTLSKWYVENKFMPFTTEELIAELERRNNANHKTIKIIGTYGISSEAELEEIRLAAKAVYEYYFGKESNCFDASTADLTEGDGLHWGLLAIQVMEKSIEKNMDYETVLKEYLLSADPENKKLYWIDESKTTAEE